MLTDNILSKSSMDIIILLPLSFPANQFARVPSPSPVYGYAPKDEFLGQLTYASLSSRRHQQSN
ncbi:hypothetical protein I7I53_06839 [Histoplasma capsulatum var. duboisii H88]|uniref:Uncharacterized protein n=1 Tax=Ajellomyces capsulatus (strain H88) TaxID=544711 RepID=A0A8A1LCK6_AJEC8|nr:hypothetical protein I7I53_06839 [Histoplasma capsulatum var. duboisii H88]